MSLHFPISVCPDVNVYICSYNNNYLCVGVQLMAEYRNAATYPCRTCGMQFTDRSNRARHERNQCSSGSVAGTIAPVSCAVVHATGDSASSLVSPPANTGFTIHEQIRIAIESLLDSDFGRPVPVLVAQLQAKIPSLSAREAVIAVAAASAAVKRVHSSHQNLTMLKEEGDTSRVKSIIARRLVYLGEGPQWNLPGLQAPGVETVPESELSSPLDLTATEERNAIVGNWILKHQCSSTPQAALGAPTATGQGGDTAEQGQPGVEEITAPTLSRKPNSAERSHPRSKESTPPVLFCGPDDSLNYAEQSEQKEPTPLPPASSQKSAGSVCNTKQARSKEPSPPSARVRTHSISITCRSTITSCDTCSVSSTNESVSPSPKRSSHVSVRSKPAKAVTKSSHNPSPSKPAEVEHRDTTTSEQPDRRPRSGADRPRHRSPSTSGHGRRRRDFTPPPPPPPVSRGHHSGSGTSLQLGPPRGRRSPPHRRSESGRDAQQRSRHSRQRWDDRQYSDDRRRRH